MRRKSFLAGMSAAALLVSLSPVIPVFAAPPCNGSTFDTFTLGSVNGQDGWKATGPFDQAVVSNSYGYATFGCQTLRISDAVTSGSFGDQVFAKPLTDSVGETGSTADGFSVGTKKTHFEMQFDLASTEATQQPGMHMSVSPDRGDGSRMSYLRFDDLADGIHVYFDDVTNPGPLGTGSSFNETDIATITRTPHTIKLTLDTLDGPGNDIVKVYIDGVLKHTGTSWEDYYRYDPESVAEQSPRIVKTILFRESGTATPADAGKGYVIDNVSTSASDPVPASPVFWTEEDTTQVKIEWKAVPGATAYRVYHSTNNVAFSQIFDGNALAFTHAVTTGSNNYYRVTAYNDSGESSTVVPAKYAGARDVVVDDDALAADFNATGTVTQVGSGWMPYHINNTVGVYEQVLSFATGGDNYSIGGIGNNQTFQWKTNASLNGHYDVFVNYICDQTRGTPSYNVYSGVTQLNGAAIPVNQSLRTSDGSPCGSQQNDDTTQPFWKLLGNFSFADQGSVKLVSAVGNNILADAVAFHKTSDFACGNSIVEPGEQCDDGNVMNGDSCTSTCQLPPGTPMCNGMAATVYVNGSNKIVGGPQNGSTYAGTLNGTNGDDVIVGTSGADTIFGKDGNDTICAGDGPDIVTGGMGNDWIDGQDGPDNLKGNDGNDMVFGGNGSDNLEGNLGDDTVVGGSDADQLKGQAGDDLLCAGNGDDQAEGGDDADKIDGGAGTDILKGQAGTDICRQGENNATCEQVSAVALPECAAF